MTAPQDPFEKPAAGPPPVPPAPGYGPPPPGYGPPPPGYGPPPPGYGGWGPAPQSRTNGMAIASLVCGIVGCFYGVPAILAIVFGFVARGQIKREPQQGSGMALAGIILGIAWIVIGIALVLALFVFGTTTGHSGCISSDGSYC